MKIMTFNVGIWTRNTKKSDRFYWKDRMNAMGAMLNTHLPDVICFQELWFPASRYVPRQYRKVFGTGWEHPIYVRRGVKVGFRMFSIFWSMAKVNGIRIFSVHGHWSAKRTERICDSLRAVYANGLTPSVLAGDWNVEYADLYKHTQLLNSARVVMHKAKEDTYVHFTDPDRRGEIDHILAYQTYPRDYKIIYGCFGAKGGRISDHYPIMVVYGE